MPKLSKETLTAGRYSVPDETGKERRIVEFPEVQVQHLRQRFEDMKAAGLHVPLCWEHQDSAKPAAQRLADKARLIFGYADDAAIIGQTLGFNLDVPDEADAKQAQTARFVSPEIVYDWVDGSGHLWPGPSITHIAVTGKPVQHDQQPFQRLSVVRLSLADRLGANTVADEPRAEDKPADKPKGKIEPSPEDVKTGTQDINVVLASLIKLGVTLPDDTTFENLGDRLIGAAAMKAGVDPSDPAKTPDNPRPVQDGNVMMSLEDRVKTLENENGALRKKTLDGEKSSLGTRIKALFSTGRVSKVIHDKLTAELGTVRLSLSEDGAVVQTTLAAKVEAYEALPASASFPADRLSQAREVPPPAGEPNHSPQTEAEVNAVVAQWDASLGRAKK